MNKTTSSFQKDYAKMLDFINKEDYENKFLKLTLSDPSSALILV